MESALLQNGMPHIPNEIFKMILSCVPTESLLQKCRLVNLKWWEYSTEICSRSREVRLKGIPPSTTLSCAQAQLRKVPWSSYIFQKDAELSKEVKSFISTFGFHLRKVIVEANYSKPYVELEFFAREVLKFTPNLQFLSIHGKFKWEASSGVYETLRHLKSLELSGDSLERQEHVDWFIQLFGKSPLATISLSIKQDYEETVIDMEPVVHKLRQIPTVALCLQLYHNPSRPEFLGPFLKDPPRLRKFGFWIGVGRKEEDAPPTYAALRKLLENSGEGMEELEMGGDGGTEPFPCSTFQFPFLPKLKFLKLSFPGNQNHFVSKLFLKLSPLEMPNLERIEIRDMIFPSPSIPVFFFQREHVFESVTELLVDSSHKFGNSWDRTFPNLRKLRTKTFWTPSYVQEIYNLRHLEELELKALVNEEFAKNASQCFSGIPTSEKIQGKTDEEIKEIQQHSQLPCILQLTKLRVFQIEFKFNAAELNDSVGHTFLQMPPMDKLSFFNVNMTEETKVKIAGGQSCFKIN